MPDQPIDEDMPREILLGPSHASEAGPRWTATAVARLQDLAAAGVAAEVIAQAMHRPLGEIIAKAAELGLPIAPEDRTH